VSAFTPAAWMMLTVLFLRSPTNLRAYGADDELSHHVLDPVLSLGHFNSSLLAHFCQAPTPSKPQEFPALNRRFLRKHQKGGST
jgi:hypothetical protein